MLKIIEMLIVAAACALCAAFFVLFIGKTGIRDKVIEGSRIRLVSEMFNCDFCLCFWTSVVISVPAALVLGDIRFVICAAMSAPIARHLL